MEELYWITRLDSVFILLKVIMLISSLAIGFLGIVAISSIMEGYNDNDYDKEGRRLIKKMIKIASVVLVASAGMYIAKRVIAFYDMKNKCTFSCNGKRKGNSYRHYAPFEYPMPDLAKEALQKLED